MAKLWGNGGLGEYVRLYDNLTQEELLSLIEDAKQNHWTELDLSWCGLNTLPEELGELSDLLVLDLSNFINPDEHRHPNTFKDLPETICNLSNLKKLILIATPIEALPEAIGHLSNLRSLEMDFTRITAFPDSIGTISKFRELGIIHTPLSDTLPPEILEQSPQEIIRYVLKMQSGAIKRYFNESKMVVVGQGGVGKSCVINRLLHDDYKDNLSTEGIDITKWKFKGDDGKKYTLNVWDFGGQEIYHSTHQFFLTHRTLYLLVWDVRQEDEYGRMDYWLRTVQNLAGNSPIVIVVNKCDDELGRHKYIENTVLDRYPQIQRVFYVSCKDGTHIGELREFVKSLAVELPLMKTVWLEKWLSVRRELERLSKKQNFIEYPKYLHLCASMEMDEAEAVSLAKYLHDLGIILYYHEDPLLKNLVILVPEWGTKAVYKILDEQQKVLKSRNGVLKQSDLPKIWGDTKENRDRYPSALYPHLLNLMQNFELAFKINPDRNDTDYLVAELLDVNPVRAKWPKSGPEPLAFRYAYDFLPAGVMTRLIVSVHEYLETSPAGRKQCWLKGAYLCDRSARAKVTLYDGIDRKYVDVRIVGDVPRERQHLLTVVREHVNKINSRFTKIVITEQVPCKCSQCLHSENPHFFKYDTLLKAEGKQHHTVECPESLEQVSVSSLLDGVELMAKKERRYEEDMEIMPRIGQTGKKNRLLVIAGKAWKLFLDFLDYLVNHPKFAAFLLFLILYILGRASLPAIPTLLHGLFPDFFPAPSSEIVP